MVIQERYQPIPLAADVTRDIPNNAVNGFIAVTAGTITVSAKADTNTGPSVTVLNAFPVTAGSVYTLALFLGYNGGTVALAGGASGTLLVT